MDNKRFLELAEIIEKLGEEKLKYQEELEMQKLGLNTYHQDPVSGLVYKIVKPKGTYMYYKDVDYVRTAKADERQGTLSKKEATEAGFAVLGKS